MCEWFFGHFLWHWSAVSHHRKSQIAKKKKKIKEETRDVKEWCNYSKRSPSAGAQNTRDLPVNELIKKWWNCHQIVHVILYFSWRFMFVSKATSQRTIFFFSNWSLTLHHSGPGFHSSVHSPVSPLWAPSPQTVCESSVEVLLERRPVPPDSAICWSTVQYSLLPYTNPFISPGSWQPAVKELTVWEVKGDQVWYTDTFTDRNWSQKPSKTSNLEKKPKSACSCLWIQMSFLF